MENTERLIRIAGLIAGKRENFLSPEQEQMLEEWLAEQPENRKLYEQLLNDPTLIQEIDTLEEVDVREAFSRTWKRIESKSVVKVVPLRSRWLRYSAAVVILLGTALAIYFNRYDHRMQHSVKAITEPGSSRAVLITSGQEQIVLGDRDKPLNILDSAGLRITDSSSVLSYHAVTQPVPDTGFVRNHTLITPRGGEYTVVLSDGTSVTLNAGSQLIFPEKFISSERSVELKGEAYFRVSKSTRPFVVHTSAMDVRVYGTEFNLSDYPDEDYAHATLLEGSVGVKTSGAGSAQEYRLSPGEQLKYDNSSGQIRVGEVDTDLVTAWINGMFRFDDENLGTIMRTLGRWYDFTYHFDDPSLAERSFTCDLPKYETIVPILEMIDLASDIEFVVQHNELVIRRKE